MKIFRKKLLIFILLLMCDTILNAEVVKIPPIVIKSKDNRLDNPTDILSNLKKAIIKNRKSNQPSKEEEAKSILDILKKSIPTQIQSNPLPKKIKKKKKIKKVPRKSIKKKIHKIKRKSKIKDTKKRIKKKIAKKNIKKTTKVVTLKTKKVHQKQNHHIKNTIYKSTKPIGFVKTLGVVGKSEVYEINNLVMDKKENITNEGIADISTATIETDELKSLPFVKPIEILKVTQPFEASEAKKYQLEKR